MSPLEQAEIDLATPEIARGSWRDALTRDEIEDLLTMRDGRSWLTLSLNWSVVFGAMAMVAVWPNPLTVVAALFLIGARQLGCAVMMHDAAHRALFSDRRVNDWVGNWLAAYPIWSNTETYRPYHLQHHAHTWTERDPDLKLATPFPISRESFRRKLWRDLSGQTGVKFARFGIKRDLASGPWPEKLASVFGNPRMRGVVIANAALFSLCALAGHPLVYLLWPGAWLTTNTLVTRIRAIAEHSMVPDPSDPLNNTRTTVASWWERLLLAPIGVNYHLEHHLLMTVPHYNLPRMHRLLRERGVLDNALVVHGYASVLRKATSLKTA